MRFWLLLPLWLALAIGEHSVVHVCPTHAPAPAQQQQGHDEHASHGAPAGDTGHGNHACSCIDACAAAAVAAIPQVAGFAAPAVVAFAPRGFEHVTSSVTGSPQLRLPFPNGPPAIAG